MEEVQAKRYIDHLTTIMESTNVIRPRGEEVKEIQDLQLIVNPRFPFMTFEARKYDINYFKKEMMWKLGASQYDRTIMNHAKMWTNVINPDGTFNSNYGKYWFGAQGGIWSVVTELIRDPDSRRAVIPMLNHTHMEPWVKDTVCTEAVGFRIRNNVLNMSIHMRSSDSVYGLGTDIPTFTALYQLVMALLSIPGRTLQLGEICITAMSSHIYSRHYDMVEKIIMGGTDEFFAIPMPNCGSMAEAMYIISSRGKMNNILEWYKYAQWLNDIL